MKTGIYGGTFNPIHNGHLHIVEEFRRGLGLDRVLLIPTRVPPHKAAPDLASAQDRCAMCRLAIQEKPWLELSDIEMRREGKSYTAETLEELSALYPQDQFYLLMGEDMFLTLDRWYRPETIFSLASVCTTPRSADGLAPCGKRPWSTPGGLRPGAFWSISPICPSAPPKCGRRWPGGRTSAAWCPRPWPPISGSTGCTGGKIAGFPVLCGPSREDGEMSRRPAALEDSYAH